MVLLKLADTMSGGSVPVLIGISQPMTLTSSRPEIAMTALEASGQRGDFPATAPAANPVFYRTYSRRTSSGRESWNEVSTRNLQGLQQLGKLRAEEVALMSRMQAEKKALPSGRWLWIGGTDWIERAENFSGAYNCTSTNLVDWEAFGLMMDLAMMGCGTGAVIEPHLIDQLPVVRNPIKIVGVTDIGLLVVGSCFVVLLIVELEMLFFLQERKGAGKPVNATFILTIRNCQALSSRSFWTKLWKS